MGLFDWLKRRPSPPPDAARVASWVRQQIVERERAGDALALADACAALNGRGAMVFGMVSSTLQGDDVLRDEALAALRRVLPERDDPTSETVFVAIERGQLPIDLGPARARARAAQEALTREAVAAFRTAVQACDAYVLAEAWGALRHRDEVLGVAIPQHPDTRAALREVARERLDELLPTVPDHEWLRTAAAIRHSNIRVTYAVDARTAEVQASRRADRDAQQARSIAGEPSNDDLEHAIATNPDDDEAYAVYADWLTERDHPRGELIALQLRGDPSLDAAIATHLDTHADLLLGPLGAYRRVHDGEAFTWRRGFIDHARLSSTDDLGDSERLVDILELLVSHPSGRFLRSLDIGIDGDPSNSLDDVVATIAALRPPHLRSLLLGDFTEEQAMISYFDLGNLAPLWGSQLRRLVLHGGVFVLGDIDLPEVEHVEIQTGSLAIASARSIAEARWPRLRFLDVWTGDPNYEGDTTIEHLEPLLERTDLVELTHLGLMNSAYADDICRRLPRAPLSARLRELDLSLGTMSNGGAQALVAAAAAFPQLVTLDVSKNYLGKTAIAALRRAFPNVIANELREADDDDRFVAVGE